MYTLSHFFPSFKSFSYSVYDSNCHFLTYIQTFQETGKVIWYSHFLKNFPKFVVVLYVKGFSIISEADENVFWDSLAFSMIQWILPIWYLVPQTSLYIWKFSVHVVLKLSLKEFEHYFASKWDECNCMIGWTFIGIAFLLDWKENWPFPALWPLLSFPNLLTYWMQHFKASFFRIFKWLSWNSITSPIIVCSDAS